MHLKYVYKHITFLIKLKWYNNNRNSTEIKIIINYIKSYLNYKYLYYIKDKKYKILLKKLAWYKNFSYLHLIFNFIS